VNVEVESGKGYLLGFLFHFVGFFSLVSLLLLAGLLLPDALRGDFQVVGDYFDAYPGIEPFVIFVLPIILIGGPAWGWMQITRLKTKPGTDRGEIDS